MFGSTGKHRKEDEEDKRPVGEERTKITPEQREKAKTPPEERKGGKGRHRA